MWVKICGITSVPDVSAAVAAGADAIGLNLVAGPRRVDVQTAETILSTLGASASAVILTPWADGRMPDEVWDLLARFRVPYVQPYGHVTPQDVSALLTQGVQTLLVQRVSRESFPLQTREFVARCGTNPPAAILLDAGGTGRLGGTGRTVDWDCVAAAQQSGVCAGWPPLILAGGLTPENVAQAVSVVRPWGVDVSSGVESAPGRKSAEKMRAFVTASRSATT